MAAALQLAAISNSLFRVLKQDQYTCHVFVQLMT
jgi:hypothetical protein